ncbi:MAG TPA: HutD family protein [Bordetella sp.]
MSLQRFDRASLPASPWKNGGGVTREIACYPAGAGMDDFLWRLSIATVAASGPFSAFPGIDRIITLLDGPGVRLTSDDGALDHTLARPLEPFAFAGETAIHGAVLGAASSDFNVMARRAKLRAQLDVLRASAACEAAEHGMLLAVSGGWHAHDAQRGAEHRLEPGQGLWWAAQALAWRLAPLSPGASLIAVRLLPAARPCAAP